MAFDETGQATSVDHKATIAERAYRLLTEQVGMASELAAALERAEVAIDFSTPESTAALVAEAVPKGVALVIATTGFSPEALAQIQAASTKIPVVMAPNFSLGVHILLELVAEASRRLQDYEIEVLELHHSRKADAPSGTALRLARVAAEARGVDLDQKAVYHREGQTGPRPADAIGIQTLRAGDSVGEHTVYFAGPGERLELSHRALSRDNFAAGAIRATRWIVGKPPRLYTLSGALGFALVRMALRTRGLRSAATRVPRGAPRDASAHCPSARTPVFPAGDTPLI